MRKLLNSRLVGIALLSILVVILGTGVALAVYTLTIPSTVTVLGG